MGILEFGRPAMRHAASEGSTGLDWDWLPKKELRKPIGALSALVVAATCSTVRASMELAANEEGDPTTVTDQIDDLPQPAVPGDSIGTGANSSADGIEVDGASRVGVCNIWQEQGFIGRGFVCPDTSTQINPDVQPLADSDFQTAGGSNPDTQVLVDVDSIDQSTTA